LESRLLDKKANELTCQSNGERQRPRSVMELRARSAPVRAFSGASTFAVTSEKKWIESDSIAKPEGRVGGEGCLRLSVSATYLTFRKVEARL
jgi:hypothetical protein